MALETLSSTPRLASIVARSALARGPRSQALPDTTLRLVDVRVDRANLLAYQRLCGFAVGDLLPHTYPHLLGFPLHAELMSRPSFPLPLLGLVHLENVVTVHRPLRAEDRFEVTVAAQDLRAHAKGQQVDLVTRVLRGSELAWEGRSTYLTRGNAHPDADPVTAPPPLPTGFPAATWTLPSGLGREYAAVSGDVNPIHLHQWSAKAMGFRRAIAHGMWTYARVLGSLGASAARPSTSQVWFRKPVFLPGQVDLVVGKDGGRTTAGLRSTRRPEVEHLVLTLDEHHWDRHSGLAGRSSVDAALIERQLPVQ